MQGESNAEAQSECRQTEVCTRSGVRIQNIKPAPPSDTRDT